LFAQRHKRASALDPYTVLFPADDLGQKLQGLMARVIALSGGIIQQSHRAIKLRATGGDSPYSAIMAFGRLPPSFANFRWIRGGVGVVGRLTPVATAAVLVLGVIAYRLNSEVLLMVTAVGVVLFVGGLFYYVLNWAERNPGLAVTEGIEAVHMARLQMAAKGVPELPSSPIVSDPQNPTLEPSAIAKRADE